MSREYSDNPEEDNQGQALENEELKVIAENNRVRNEIANAEKKPAFKPIKFTANHTTALDLLADGAKVEDVAKEVGLTQVTIKAWMKNRSFSDKLDKLIISRHPHYVADLQRRIQERIRDKEEVTDTKTYYDYLELSRKTLQGEKDPTEGTPYQPLVIIKQVFVDKEPKTIEVEVKKDES